MIEDRLLVTRFSPHAEELVDQFNNHNIFAIAQPLLTVEPSYNPVLLQKFLDHEYDYVIAVSGNAVTHTQKQINQRWPSATYFAVGDSTKKLLSHVTKQLVISPSSHFDSEGLLKLDLLQEVKGKKVLILRGEGGRDFLAESLTQRGATVTYFQTYKRVNITLNGLKLVNNWQQALINGAIISSVEILNQLFTLVPNEHKCWLTNLTFYVPSQRIADRALQLGIKKIELLPSLRLENIVEFFKRKNGDKK